MRDTSVARAPCGRNSLSEFSTDYAPRQPSSSETTVNELLKRIRGPIAELD